MMNAGEEVGPRSCQKYTKTRNERQGHAACFQDSSVHLGTWFASRRLVWMVVLLA
jgi:hypothetical protein